MEEERLIDRRRLDKVIEDLQTCQQSVNDRLHVLDIRSKKMEERQIEMFNKQEKIKDLLEAWDNAKGFASVIKGLSATTKIIAPILLFFTLVTAFAISGWSWFVHQIGLK